MSESRETKILVVTGSAAPDACGVGDYVQSLLEELQRQGVSTERFLRRNWALSCLTKHVNEIRKSKSDVVNVQYPTEGYGYSIVPQLICCFIGNCKRLITLHEFSRKSLKGKLAIYIFFLFADWIIFTSEAEQATASRVAPWLKDKSSVIPIGSNIPLRDAQPPDTDIVYFGLIRPEKGLEKFIAALSHLNAGRKLRVRVIGQVVSGYEEYATEILKQIEGLGAEILLNREAAEVSDLLSRAKIAFLPFPDGMSRRRGSALAAMGNGALVVTTAGSAEPDFFRQVCAIPADNSELLGLLTDVLENYESYQSIRLAGQKFAQSLSWKSVAVAYVDVIDRMLKNKKR